MTKDVRIQFSHRLRKLRTEVGMTQEQLARKSDISVKYLKNLESNDPKNPMLVILDKVSKGLELSPSELLDF